MIDWNDETLEMVRSMWADGYSASEIAAKIPGSTRNAVLGKIHRLGLQQGARTVAKPTADGTEARAPRPKGAPRKRKVAPSLAPPPTAEIIPLPVRPAEEPEEEAELRAEPFVPQPDQLGPGAPETLPEGQLGGFAVLALDGHTCRWPIGEPHSPTFRFCCAPGAEYDQGRPYCPLHARVASSGLVPKRQYIRRRK